jgi:hypothetical protein
VEKSRRKVGRWEEVRGKGGKWGKTKRKGSLERGNYYVPLLRTD